MQVDSKKELEKALKTTCEAFIMGATKSTVEEMLSFITKVTAVKVASTTGTVTKPLREQARCGLAAHAPLCHSRPNLNPDLNPNPYPKYKPNSNPNPNPHPNPNLNPNPKSNLNLASIRTGSNVVDTDALLGHATCSRAVCDH